MTIDRKDKELLIKYRIEQAYEAVNTAKLLIDNNMLATAINRIYYGIFYSLLSLGLKYGYETSKHSQLIGWFNKEIIHKNVIDVEFGKILRRAYENRRTGDYDAFIEFEKKEVEVMIVDMEKFIKQIETLI